jgi:uncharacterized protein
MAQSTDIVDLDALHLRSGEGRRLEPEVAVDRLQYGGEPYDVSPRPISQVLDVNRMTHAGFALRLRFSARLHGPCMRCLEPAEPEFHVDSREISQPGAGDELQSPYVKGTGELDLRAWTQDALSLAVPDQILCRPDCAGLCPKCGADLNEDPDHRHEPEPDNRWAKLSEIKFD